MTGCAGGPQILAGHVGQSVGQVLARLGEPAHEGVELTDLTPFEEGGHRCVRELVTHLPQGVHGLARVGHGLLSSRGHD